LPNCQINAYGILQIAQMLTEIECLTDLNLDNNPNVQENYFLLCTPARKYVIQSHIYVWLRWTVNLMFFSLHYLSLKMCKLSDKGIQKIMDELKYRDSPNDPKLIALNVADNDITDVGAKYIAAMLRTNR